MNWINFALIIHIISGFSALASGLLALIFTKGSSRHIISGRAYFWSMAAVTLTAFLISIVKNNSFLLAISLFSFYFTYTGYRSVKLKIKKLQPGDLIASAGLAVTSLFMIFSGEIILLVFGSISIIVSTIDILKYVKSRKPGFRNRNWLTEHIGRICGSYIATVTAFLVVNITFVHPLVIWLGPTVIGSPLISLWIFKYKAKKKRFI